MVERGWGERDDQMGQPLIWLAFRRRDRRRRRSRREERKWQPKGLKSENAGGSQNRRRSWGDFLAVLGNYC